MGFAAKPAA